jgi:molecular chaperone DnaJ
MALTLTHCFRVLEIPRESCLDEVKSAYRRLAFKLHPDLNPDDPKAAAKFQKLNEAYVFLSRHLSANPRPESSRTKAQGPPPPGPKPGPDTPPPPPPGSQPGPSRATPPPGPGLGHSETSWRERGTFRKEDVLSDILKDPFARQVFEDIYRQIKDGHLAPDRSLRRRKLSLSWGGKAVDLDLSQGVLGGIKSWAKGQLDHEETVHFPYALLKPGRTIRVSIARRFGPERTLDITLPADFVPGRPIRLKGQGRKLGPLTGDLILKVLPK